MKLLFTIILSLNIVASTIEAQSSWHKVTDLPANLQAVSADDLGNIYYFDKGYQLVKTDTTGKTQFTYSNKLFGENSMIIPGNAFKTYVLLKDYNLLLVLDKRLQLSGQMDLSQIGFITVTMVAPSIDNRSLWIFDRMKGEAIELDDRQTFLRTTGPLEQYYGLPKMPDRMQEKAGRLYLFYENVGVAIFDDKGVYENYITFPQATSLTLSGEKIVYVNPSGQMEVYDPKTFVTVTVESPFKLKALTTGWQYFLLQNEMNEWSVYRAN